MPSWFRGMFTGSKASNNNHVETPEEYRRWLKEQEGRNVMSQLPTKKSVLNNKPRLLNNSNNRRNLGSVAKPLNRFTRNQSRRINFGLPSRKNNSRFVPSTSNRRNLESLGNNSIMAALQNSNRRTLGPVRQNLGRFTRQTSKRMNFGPTRRNNSVLWNQTLGR